MSENRYLKRYPTEEELSDNRRKIATDLGFAYFRLIQMGKGKIPPMGFGTTRPEVVKQIGECIEALEQVIELQHTEEALVRVLLGHKSEEYRKMKAEGCFNLTEEEKLQRLNWLNEQAK